MPSRYTASCREISYDDRIANSHKFYRAWLVCDAMNVWYVIFNWGRIGSKGQFSVPMVCPTQDDAFQQANKKIQSKMAKGYGNETDTNFPYCPADILDLLKQSADPTGDARPAEVADLATDLIGVLFADIDVCRRLAMGDSADVTKAIVMRKSLSDQLDTLRVEVLKAEGAAELVDMMLAAKLDA